MDSLLTHLCVTQPQWVNAHLSGSQPIQIVLKDEGYRFSPRKWDITKIASPLLYKIRPYILKLRRSQTYQFAYLKCNITLKCWYTQEISKKTFRKSLHPFSHIYIYDYTDDFMLFSLSSSDASFVPIVLQSLNCYSIHCSRIEYCVISYK